MELRGHAIPERRLLPFTLVALELEALSGAASLSDSCTVVLIEVAAAPESQLEIVSEVPGDSIRFSSDGRVLHLPSLVRIAA